MGTPDVKTWPDVEKLPLWKNFADLHIAPTKLSQIVPRLDELGVDLLDKMLRLNPSERAPCKDIIKHPWFNDVP